LEFKLKEINVPVFALIRDNERRKCEKISRMKSSEFPSPFSWAHAAIAATESQFFIEYGKLYDLSEQELVDCVAENLGCGGGG
jgi:hypothetical protein